MLIEGKVAFITGGASGLGEAAALELSNRGCLVVIADTNKEKGENLAKTIGKKAIFIEVDVTNEDSVREGLEKAAKALGAIHILVNCAGIFIPTLIASAEGSETSENFKKIMDVNFYGVFYATKYAAKIMASQPELNDVTKERGVIINIGGIAALEGQTGQFAYCATKGAMIAMTLPAARELSRFGIRVVTISPGFFNTKMGNDFNSSVIKALTDSIPTGRFGEPKEFAAFLCSVAENSYLTGVNLRIDGGMKLAHL